MLKNLLLLVNITTLDSDCKSTCYHQEVASTHTVPESLLFLWDRLFLKICLSNVLLVVCYITTTNMYLNLFFLGLKECVKPRVPDKTVRSQSNKMGILVS